VRPGPAATACVLLAAALVAAGCGEGRGPSTGPAAGPGGAAAPAPPAAQLRCRRQVSGFLASLGVLRERLAVGLSYHDYLRAVRQVRRAYEEVPAARLAAGCLLAAGTPGERALNRYLDAANVWGECLATPVCETEAVEPRLQRRWALASDLLSSAQRGLRAMSRPPPS